MNYLSNKEGMLRAVTFFMDKHKEKEIFSNGDEVKPISNVLYVNKEIVIGGGRVSLLNGATNNEIGVTNFDGNRLEQGRAFAVDGVSFFVGIGDAGSKAYNVDYAKALSTEQLKAFQFSNLVLKQNNEVLFRQSISSISDGKLDYSEYLDLDLTLVRPEKQIELEIEFPDEIEAPVLEDGKAIFVSPRFRGYESYQRR